MDPSYLLKPQQLLPGEEPWAGRIAFVVLDDAAASIGQLVLPPCPVIGLGQRSHPAAAWMDAVIEPPVAVDAVLRQVLANPRAAAIAAQLLRVLPELSADSGLTAESLAYATLQGSGEHHAWLNRHGPSLAAARGAIDIERRGNRLLVTLASPSTGNAIDRAMRDALYEAFALASIDREIATIELRATGRAFSIGAALGEFGTTTDPATAHAIRGLTLPARALLGCAGRLEVHVRGACVGAGLELAAWGARITATRSAWFQLPELAMGILPGAGGCVSLTRKIGRQRTALLILSGKRIGPRHALEWGLIDAVVDDRAGGDRHAHVV